MSPTTPPNPFHFKITIYTDTVCPFSYLGHLSLSRAITTFSSSSPHPCVFSLTYHPYILYPTSLPSSGKLGEALSYIYSSRPSSSRPSPFSPTELTPLTGGIISHLTTLAKTYNITLNFSGLTGNSRDSHRLILLAQSRLSASKMQGFMTTLYKSNFELGLDISNRETLAKLGVDAGIWTTQQQGMDWLRSDELGTEVDELCERAKREVGVRAVPSYVVNDRWVVGGMQTQEVWEGLFTRIIATTAQEATGGETATATTATTTATTTITTKKKMGSDIRNKKLEEKDGKGGEMVVGMKDGGNCRVVGDEGHTSRDHDCTIR
ncbi:thioredoxin-like protein [Triangularia verruculosa]|uniref:Thioredoxin-like protein n=1 Tax=Triangularia verruculosa TaxID=2587418 RepID=A0AAN6XCQ2_9PEZI|nr:thioredoxin-like protein [Triangularia verruculosa]